MDNDKVIPDPANLPLLIHDTRPRAREALSKVLAGDLNMIQQMDTLSRYFNIKIWFSKPIHFKTIQRKKKVKAETIDGVEHTYYTWRSSVETDCHTFNRIVHYQGQALYTVRRGLGKGYYLPLDFIVKWEPLPHPKGKK